MPPGFTALAPHAIDESDPDTSDLHALIIANEGSAEVMQAAASEAEDPEVQRMFESIAQVRERHAAGLRQLSPANGSTPGSGRLTDTLRAYWITLHGALTGGDPETIIADALPAEQKIEAAYVTALQGDWPGAVEAILRQQLAVVSTQHQRILEMHALYTSAG